MHNAETVGEALHWLLRISRAAGAAFRIIPVIAKHGKWATVEYDLLPAPSDRHIQAAEYGLAMIYYRLIALSGNPDDCEVWFSHGPVSHPKSYREHFSARVYFNKPYNAIRFSREYIDRPIQNRKKGVYELAKYYIDNNYPEVSFGLRSEAERIAGRLLEDGSCTLPSLALELGLHPRTLQRRLSEAGVTFFQIKDSAQRSLAQRYLEDRAMSLKQVATRLGFVESSSFTRSCRRWFSAPPRRVRSMLFDGRIQAAG